MRPRLDDDPEGSLSMQPVSSGQCHADEWQLGKEVCFLGDYIIIYLGFLHFGTHLSIAHPYVRNWRLQSSSSLMHVPQFRDLW